VTNPIGHATMGRGGGAQPISREDPGRRGAPRDDEMSVIAVLNFLLRYRAMIVSAGLIAMVLVIGISLIVPRHYTAHASFISQTRRPPTDLSGFAAQLGLSGTFTDAGESPPFYADLIVSNEILSPVADHAYTVGNSRTPKRLADIFGIRESSPGLTHEATVRRLRSLATAGVVQKTGAVNLSVRARDAGLSYQLVNAILAELNKFNVERRRTQASAERQFTEQRLAESRDELRQAEDALEQFYRDNRVSSAPHLSLQAERLNREVGLRQQLYSNMMQAYEQARIEEVRDTPLISIVERPTVPVSPDSRNILQRGIIGLVVGIAIGVLLALFRYGVSESGAGEAERLREFQRLRSEMVDDVLHPWRPIRRMVRTK
jgi:uncharacterized protein involved in exopolysaccharide biosynthesis